MSARRWLTGSQLSVKLGNKSTKKKETKTFVLRNLTRKEKETNPKVATYLLPVTITAVQFSHTTIRYHWFVAAVSIINYITTSEKLI